MSSWLTHDGVAVVVDDLPTLLEPSQAESVACTTDIFSFGMQPFEPAALVVRTVCCLVTASLLSSWIDWRKVQRRPLFFAYWAR